MYTKILGLLFAISLPALSLLAQQPASPQPGGRGQAPQPGGQTQAPARYELTPQDREAIGAKLNELDSLVRALKSTRSEDDLMADVEVYAKAGHWFLEFPQDVTVQEDVANAIKVLDRGIARATHLQGGQSPWKTERGRGAFGFYSPLDGSVQPFLLTIPESYNGTRPARLDVWLHGRAQRLIETNFICSDPSPANLQAGPRLYTHAAGSCMTPSPQPTATGAANVGQFQLEVFARGNNANHWAGETDVFESIAAVQRRFKIDSSRIFLRGFSLGGAGAWHLALHYPDRWAAAEIGAGTWPRRYLMMDMFPPHQRPTLRIWENMTEWALNAFNLPIAAHDGDSDTQVASIPPPPQGSVTRGQLESSIRIREQLAKEGYPSEGVPNDLAAKGTPAIFLISENTGHTTSPKVRARLDGFLKEWTDKGLQSPDHIRFLTYTTRYNKSFWVSLDGLAKHYERADIDAQRNVARTSYQIKTNNVTRLVLRETDTAAEIQIDGQTLRVKPARELALDRSAAGWSVAASTKWDGVHKTHGLQGPIDDAFLEPFLLVRPTGTPWNRAANELALKRLARFDYAYALNYRAHPRIKKDTELTEADFTKYNIVLFGDPGSNRWISRLAGKTPLQWTRDTVALGKRTFPSADHLPVLIYPSPLAPSRYVVLNSGLTISENSYRSDYSMPTLGDVAVLQMKGGVDEPEVAYAGFFDESWKFAEDAALLTSAAAFATPVAQQPQQAPPPPSPAPPAPTAGQGRGSITTFPAQQRPPGDPTLIARGNTVYGIECRSCHGADLRGGDLGGPNLLRSQVVLNDNEGELMHPIIAGSRQAQGMPTIKMSDEDVKAVAAYLHSIVATARGQGSPPAGPPVVLNVLVGNAAAGQTYFAARCSACHSATGDLAGIGARVSDAMQLQNLWVSGGAARGGGAGGAGAARGAGAGAAPSRRDVTAVVTLPSGQRVEGRLERIDDFFVTVIPEGGMARTIRRDGDVPKIEIRDPLEAHRNLLTVYTDKDIHDVTAFLATLK